MNLFDTLVRSGQLRPLDGALARTLKRLDPGTPDAVLAAAALASLAVARGDAGLPLAGPPAIEGVAASAFPDPVQWQAQLAASRWVDVPADADQPAREQAPLVLEHGLLYLRRYREYERRLATGLRRIAREDMTGDAPAEVFAAMFPEDGDASQADAARLALRQPLCLVSGGPGAGKTTTIARILLLLLARAATKDAAVPRIALAAPTGRAADRMAASLRHARLQLEGMPAVAPEWLAALPASASTLHRLLGSIPDSPRFRHHTDNPLPFDVVVVDEASMIDLPLMAKLVDAVADGSRLLLLGDPDQLPSVEAGDVLAAMMAAADDHGTLPHARLRGAWRQADALQLAPLSAAVRAGEDAEALRLLRDGALSGVHFHAGQHDPLHPSLRDGLLAPWRALLALDDPRQALAAMDVQRLLTVLREGPQGAASLNARIEDALAGARREAYFHGRLLMVTENSYRHGLFNGDTGICLRGADGVVEVWFHGEGGQPRRFLPGNLPAHASAWASTVHKAQGSEFDTVWLQLPRAAARPLTRELVYTALTRARRQLHVLGSDAVFAGALRQRVQRASGLAMRLAVTTTPAAV
ncbi:MAG: exodeoxyribonuclease V subunit alpha [Pseudoxanthomonas suwonensis]|nr:exodeoxyribonuclease V subunit alpha [Pseudoxanthomonas suwonensis]